MQSVAELNGVDVVVGARHSLFRRSLVVMLEDTDAIDVVGEVSSTDELMRLYPSALPDVVVVTADLAGDLPGGLQHLGARCVVAGVAVGDLTSAMTMLRAGAHAVHWVEDLLVSGREAVLDAYRGGSTLPDELAAAAGAALAPLASATRDVALCRELQAGRSPEVAAMELGLDRQEAGRRLRNLIGRLQVQASRGEREPDPGGQSDARR